MNDALTSAAQRLIELPGFRWMPGMLVAGDGHRPRYIRTYEDGVMHFACEVFAESMDMMRDGTKRLLPDLADPATLGCVEQMLMDATGNRMMVFFDNDHEPGDPGPWLVVLELGGQERLFPVDTRGEALVNALAAAVGGK